MREVLQRHLRPLDGKLYQVRACKISKVFRRQNGPWFISYRLRLAEADEEHEHSQLVTGVMYPHGGRARRLFEELGRGEPERTNTGTSPVFKPFFYVRQLDMLAQVFPHDHRLPALPILMAGPPPDLEISLLAGFGFGDWRTVAWHAEPVRYQAYTRATLRLTVGARDYATGREETKHHYAKVYSQQQRAEETHKVLRQLWEKACTGGETFTVGRPVAYLRGLRTVVQDEVSGTFLDEVLSQEGKATRAVRMIARSLAGLHLSDVIPPRRHRLRDEVVLLKAAQEELQLSYPHLGPEINDIYGAVVAGLEEVSPAPTHGELRPRHLLLLEDDRFALLDLDTFVGADPIRDVAHLAYALAQTVSPGSLLRSDRAQALVQPFVEEYFAHVPEAWRARLPFLYAGTAFKKATVLARRETANRTDEVVSLLEEAKHSLQGTTWCG